MADVSQSLSSSVTDVSYLLLSITNVTLSYLDSFSFVLCLEHSPLPYINPGIDLAISSFARRSPLETINTPNFHTNIRANSLGFR